MVSSIDTGNAQQQQGSMQGAPQRPRLGGQGGYYSSYRNGSYGFQRDNGYADNYQTQNNMYQNRPPMIRPPPSTVMYGQNQENISPTHDNMTSGSEENKDTAPSSVNSSLDFIQPLRKPDEFSETLNNGYMSKLTFAPYGTSAPLQNGYQDGLSSYGPPAPPKDSIASSSRAPIKLNSGTVQGTEVGIGHGDGSPKKEKRGSWLSRRFSRRKS